jgi:hypothetical protein
MARKARREWVTRLPWGLLGTLLAVLCVEHLLALQKNTLTPAYAAVAKRAGLASRREAPKCEILCFGDSLMQFGFVPRVLEQCLGRASYNLSIAGSYPPAAYFLLRRALLSGARPSAIVVDFKANILSGNPLTNQRPWIEMLTVRECAEMSWDQRSASYFGSLVLGKILPSYRARYDIRTFCLAAFDGSPLRGPNENGPWLRSFNVNQGATLVPDAFRSPWPAQSYIDQVFWPQHWEIDPVGGRYVRRFLELAASRHIPVFWVMPPIQESLQDGRDKRDLDEAYIECVFKLLKRFPNNVLVDGHHSAFPDSVFWDPSHLNRTGALALSFGIAQVIGSVLDRGGNASARMIALPRFQEYMLDPAPEDLDSSSVALSLPPCLVRK